MPAPTPGRRTSRLAWLAGAGALALLSGACVDTTTHHEARTASSRVVTDGVLAGRGTVRARVRPLPDGTATVRVERTSVCGAHTEDTIVKEEVVESKMSTWSWIGVGYFGLGAVATGAIAAGAQDSPSRGAIGAGAVGYAAAAGLIYAVAKAKSGTERHELGTTHETGDHDPVPCGVRVVPHARVVMRVEARLYEGTTTAEGTVTFADVRPGAVTMIVDDAPLKDVQWE